MTTVSPGRWRLAVGLLTAVTLVGMGMLTALALGWRTPTPGRPPDWTSGTLVRWNSFGNGEIIRVPTGYELRLSQPDRHAWATAGVQAADFDLELDARSLLASEDVGYGLLYRYQDPENYYVFAVGGDGYYTIGVVLQGTLTTLRVWQEWPHVHQGAATNRLRVRCQGATCRFFINGEFTAEVLDDTFLAGDVGLGGQTFSDEALHVVFGEMRLWRLGE